MRGLNKQPTIINHALFYFLGIVLINVSSFILIPFYTRYLSPSDYGVLEFIYISIEVAGIIFSAGIGTACISLYSKATDVTEKKNIISTGIITICILSLLGCVSFALFAEQLNEYFFKENNYTEYFRLGGVLLIGQLLFSVPMAYIQAEMKSRLYISIAVVQANVIMGLNIYIIGVLDAGIRGILWNTAFCSLFFSILLIIYTITKTGYGFNWSKFKSILFFGLPFIPGGIFLFIMNSADRLFIQKIMDTSTLGIYTVGYKLGTVVAMFVLGPFLRIWTPLMFKLDNESKKDMFGKYFLYLVSIYCICALLLSLYSEEIMMILTGKQYWSGYKIIPIISLAFIFWSTAAFFDSGFYITEKTYFKPLIMGTTAALVFLLYWLLIPKYGMLGGAYATAISFGTFSLITYYYSQKIYPINYPMRKYLIILGGGVVIYCISCYFLEQSGYVRWVFKFMLWCIYVIYIYKNGIIDNSDSDALRKYISDIRMSINKYRCV